MSRDLDAEVLEKVMGSPRPDPITKPLEFDHLPIRRNGWTWIDSRDEWAPFSNYSSDIAAAMEVIQRMENAGCNWMLTSSPPRYECQFTTYSKLDGQVDDVITVAADTLPEAICHAALQATAANEKVLT